MAEARGLRAEVGQAQRDMPVRPPNEGTPRDAAPLAPEGGAEPAAPSAPDEAENHFRAAAEHQAAVIREMRLALAHAAHSASSQTGGEPDQAPPQVARKLAELQDWAAENADRVIVLKRAMQAARKSLYENESQVYEALDMLAGTYRDVKLGLADRHAYKRECERLGLEFGGSITEAPGEGYFFLWRGRRTFLDQSLAKGNSRDPRYCLRIYFTWDEQEQKVIVGWLPSHLPTKAS